MRSNRTTPSLVFLALMFVINLRSVGQTIPVQAAPPAQETITNMRFYLNISYPTTLCAGREYSIPVTPLVELDGKRADGQKFNYTDRIIPGVAITAEIRDTNIATVDPAKPRSKKSGSIPEYLLGTSSLANQERLGNLGEVVFKLKAKKAGTMHKAPLTIESETLTGTGQINFMRVLSGVPYCTYNISTGKSSVAMTGSFSQDPSGSGQVKMTFDYGPMSEVVASTCTVLHFGTIGGTMDWSGAPPVAAIDTVVLPEEGRSANFLLALGGSLKVTLKQVPEQGGK